MTEDKRTSAGDGKGPNKLQAVAKAEQAGRTNKVPGSLVKCEVKLEKGDWISPPSCATYKIDADGKLPEICFEISTTQPGPYYWKWEVTWSVLACPQRRDRSRFKPKRQKLFAEKGSFTSESKTWTACLNDKVLGGQLTVKVKAGSETYVRRVVIAGTEPGKGSVLAELGNYAADYPREIKLAEKIFEQETGFCHFFSDDQPLVSFDNGYGLGQSTNPVPSFEQVWNWKKHVQYIVTVVIKEKRHLAKKYLDKHGNYTDDDLDMETLVFYNGANYHYLIWDEKTKKWHENAAVLCDPEQSNTGWDLSKKANQNKTIAQLRSGEGDAPKYTGRCYAEHIKNRKR